MTTRPLDAALATAGEHPGGPRQYSFLVSGCGSVVGNRLNALPLARPLPCVRGTRQATVSQALTTALSRRP
eukprot:3015220-Lingulodinium_polyedra.AAC.1